MGCRWGDVLNFGGHVLLHTLIFLMGLSTAAAAQNEVPLFEVSVNKYLMGTKVETTARHEHIIECKNALLEAYEEMERVETLLSSHDPNSEISRINRAAGVQSVVVSMETFEIVKRARDYGHRLKGLFDLSIGPVSELWGFNGNGDVRLPDRVALDQKRLLVDYRAIELDSVRTAVFVRHLGG